MADETVAKNLDETTTGPDLGMQQRHTIISNHPFFLHLEPEIVAELTRLMFEVKLRAGSVIVAQGELIDSIYFIAHGTAEVTRKMDLQNKSETVFLASLHENDVIGLTEKGYFAPGGIRTATVTATSDVLLLGLKIADFHHFLQDHPNFNQDTQVATELMIRMNFIREVTSFVQLSLGRIRWLAQHLEKISYPKNTVIFKQGEAGDKCYLIYSGQVEINIDEPKEGKKVLAVLKPPMMFGETALFTSSPRNATAITLDETILFAIKRQNLLELAAMEDTTNQAIRNLMVERSRPVRTPNILDYHNTTADGQEIITLKNPSNSHYYRLTKEGWFIWQQVNGRNSLREISHLFAKQFKSFDANLVPTTIYNLANAGFIQIASLNIHEQENKSAWPKLRSWWAPISIIFLVILSALIYLGFAYNHQKPISSPLTDVSVAPIVTMVMAVNVDNAPAITVENIQNGSVPILAIHNSSNSSEHQRDTLSFVNQFAQLVFFDSDQNGRIDMSDPVFSRLELVFLSTDPSKIKRLPIADAGIRAIALNKPELIDYAINNQPTKLQDVNSTVIMANGSRRDVKILPIRQNLLP
jgi:CRP-like cAMP-binding protein